MKKSMKKIRTLLSKYLTQYLTYTLACGLALVLSGCANETTAASGGGSSTGSITLTRSEIVLPIDYLNVPTGTNSDGSTNTVSGPSFTLTGLIASKTPATADVTYSSSNTSLVTVDDSGTLTVVANPSSSTNVIVTLALQGFDNAAATTELTVSFTNIEDNRMVYLSESHERVDGNDSCRVTLNVLATYSVSDTSGWFRIVNNVDSSMTNDLGASTINSGGTPSYAIIVSLSDIKDNPTFTNNSVLFSIAGKSRFASGTTRVSSPNTDPIPIIHHLSVEIVNSTDDNFYYLTSDIQGTFYATPVERTKQAYNYQCQTQPVSGS